MRVRLASAIAASSVKYPWWEATRRFASKAGAGCGGLLSPLDHVAVTGQGVGDGILSEHEDDRVVAGTRVQRSVGQDDRNTGVRRDTRPHPDQQREVATARLARETDASRIDAQTSGVRAHPAHTRGDVGARRRMLVIRALPEVERGDHHSRGGQPTAKVDSDGPIAPIPRAAVRVDDSH